MCREFDDEMIIDVIANYENRIKILDRQINNTCELLEEKEDYISAASMPGRVCDNPGNYGTNTVTDLGNVYNRFIHIETDQKKDLKEFLSFLEEQKHSIQRIYICYQVLDQTEHSVLTELYCSKFDTVKAALKELEENLELSKSTAFRIRAKAFAHIRQMYHSSLPNSMIARLIPDSKGDFPFLDMKKEVYC